MQPFRIPTRVVIEPGASSRVAESLSACGVKPGSSVLLVLDRGLAETPWAEKVAQQIIAAGFSVHRFDGVENNPRVPTVEALAENAREEGVQGVVGLGGGSVLDAAKAVAMLAVNGGRCEDYEGAGRFDEKPLPFVALPTTCGTGSEVTWVSVLTVRERRTKISIKGDGMFPDFALVDSDLLTTLPPQLVAWTGLDALTHALEARTVTLANPISDALATRAIEMLFRYLPRAVEDIAGDREARDAVMTASTLAGMAFGNADVGAVHCLSETLGGLWDVHHGLANAILLAPVLRAHGKAVQGPLASLAGLVEGGGDLAHPGARAEHFLTALDALVVELKVPTFSSLELDSEGYQEIAERAVTNGSNSSNPRPMGKRDYLEILRSLV
ncbi:MAG: iron-containing alcohol dehydrogenase [Deltaproteobacteria bacterium]|nr:iron-containing alcohol dehydrogenase [Deltaproteobacteria bacterium]